MILCKRPPVRVGDIIVLKGGPEVTDVWAGALLRVDDHRAIRDGGTKIDGSLPVVQGPRTVRHDGVFVYATIGVGFFIVRGAWEAE